MVPPSLALSTDRSTVFLELQISEFLPFQLFSFGKSLCFLDNINYILSDTVVPIWVHLH